MPPVSVTGESCFIIHRHSVQSQLNDETLLIIVQNHPCFPRRGGKDRKEAHRIPDRRQARKEVNSSFLYKMRARGGMEGEDRYEEPWV